MNIRQEIESLRSRFVSSSAHADNDYFAFIKALLSIKKRHELHEPEKNEIQNEIDSTYASVADEIKTSTAPPRSTIKFGTSGWRGIIGKDLTIKTVQIVTQAIVNLYKELQTTPELHHFTDLATLAEAQSRGCVLGHDNRFGNGLLARAAADVLTANGIKVFFAGECTTGCISAAVLEQKAAFSINLTPSHNPLDYGGFKFNAADGGPAQAQLTSRITQNAAALLDSQTVPLTQGNNSLISEIDIFSNWQSLVRKNENRHGLDYDAVIDQLHTRNDIFVVVDCVHGASRMHMDDFFKNKPNHNILFLRTDPDPTFGGIAPEPSVANFQGALSHLRASDKPLKLGVLIDPDADRIRFTDGEVDITMNHFGAMAYHFLHTAKGKSGLVAKTVATSNFANALAEQFHEKIFEPKVGFKEFKPVVDEALVCFEESDGISVIGHTPEKDAFIGLLLALDMMLSLNKPLGKYLQEIEAQYGAYYPAKDGVTVSKLGDQLLNTLAKLDEFKIGDTFKIGSQQKTLSTIIAIDGHKFIFDDASWIMIRPSGTEPKVRFYVEGRTEQEKEGLFAAARLMLQKIGLL